jgi:hypothetical protein
MLPISFLWRGGIGATASAPSSGLIEFWRDAGMLL